MTIDLARFVILVVPALAALLSQASLDLGQSMVMKTWSPLKLAHQSRSRRDLAGPIARAREMPAASHIHAPMRMPVGLRWIGRVWRISRACRHLGASAERQ